MHKNIFESNNFQEHGVYICNNITFLRLLHYFRRFQTLYEIDTWWAS